MAIINTKPHNRGCFIYGLWYSYDVCSEDKSGIELYGWDNPKYLGYTDLIRINGVEQTRTRKLHFWRKR